MSVKTPPRHAELAASRAAHYKEWILDHKQKAQEENRKAIRGRYRWGKAIAEDLGESGWGDKYVKRLAETLDHSEEWIYQHVRFAKAVGREFGEEDGIDHYIEMQEKGGRQHPYSFSSARDWMSSLGKSGEEDGSEPSEARTLVSKIHHVATSLEELAERLAEVYSEHREDMDAAEREEVEEVLVRVHSTIKSLKNDELG